MVRPIDAALEQREVAFDGVLVGFAADVLFNAVVDRLEACEFGADRAVLARVIGHQERLLVDLSHQNGPEGLCDDVGEVMRANLAAALDQREGSLFADCADVLGVALTPVGRGRAQRG